MFRLSELTEEHAKLICSWKYENEYSIYNTDWQTVCAQNWGIADKTRRKAEFTAVLNEENFLFAYFRFVVSSNTVTVGLGVNPQCCGKGNGAKLMELILHEFKARYTDQTLELDVREFNQRAIQCYSHAGFQVIDSYVKETPIGKGNFLRMQYNKSPGIISSGDLVEN